MRALAICTLLALTFFVPAHRAGGKLRVVVLDVQDKPVAGVRVCALGSWAAYAERKSLRGTDDDRDAFAIVERLGIQSVTDASGEVEVLRSEIAMHVAAIAPGKIAYEIVDDPLEERVELHLRSDASLEVRVLDANGEACADATVALYSWNEGDESNRQPIVVLRGAESGDEAGRFVFARIRILLRGNGLPQPRFGVGLHLPLRAPQLAAIDPAALPGGAITLRMPETGSVEVAMAEAPESWVRIRQLPPVGKRARERGGDTRWFDGGSIRAEFDRGVARFPHVGLGMDVQVEAHWKGAVAPASVIHAGPKTPGEKVVIAIDPSIGPGGLTLGEDEVVVLEGQRRVAIKPLFLTSSTAENDHFTLCIEELAPRGSPEDRTLSLHFGNRSTRSSAWHSLGHGLSRHLTFYLESSEADLVSKRMGVPIARMGPEAYALRPVFTPDSDSYDRGARVVVRLRLENVGALPVTIQHPDVGAYRFVATLDGRPVPFSGTSRAESVTLEERVIQPGATYESSAELWRWFAFDRPGAYSIEARYEIQLTKPLPQFVGGPPCISNRWSYTDHVDGTFRVLVR